MLEIKSLDDVRGNNVVIYTLKTLLSKHTMPRMLIFSGHMGVGKTSVARLVAEAVNAGKFPVTTYNFGKPIDMKTLEDDVFRLNPATPRAFVFEELHGLDKAGQTALLSMLDNAPNNVCVICTTTETYKVLNTLRSRATVLDFKLLGDRQQAQLLDDYLAMRKFDMPLASRNALIRASRGVPRDLLKYADLAIAGEFTSQQLDELLGQVSEDLMFTLLCSLKSPSIDFATAITPLMSGSARNNLYEIRDFYTRYVLERKGIDNPTIPKQKLEMLDSIFRPEEVLMVGETLVHSTADTLVLELSLLNMRLTGTNRPRMVGQQIDRLATNIGRSTKDAQVAGSATRTDSARVSAESLSKLHFGEE